MLGLLLVSGARRRRRWVHILLYKAFAELRFDAERYYIGYLWWVVEPIIEMAVYYVVFAELLHRFTEDFVAFLLCGLIAWRWFSATLLKGATAIVTNQPLAAQVFVPKVLFPLVTIVVNTVRFTIVLVLLMVFLVTYVVPTFATLYSTMQAQLPSLTLLLIAIGTTARTYILVFAAAMRRGITCVRRVIRPTP